MQTPLTKQKTTHTTLPMAKKTYLGIILEIISLALPTKVSLVSLIEIQKLLHSYVLKNSEIRKTTLKPRKNKSEKRQFYVKCL